MAKSKKSAAGPTAEPENKIEVSEEALPDLSEAVEATEVEVNASDDGADIEDAEIVMSSEAEEDAAQDDGETDHPSETPSLAPAPSQPERAKSGFFPLVLGGVLAAAIGVGASGYIFPNGLPFGPSATRGIDLGSELKLQSGRLDDLSARLDALPDIDGPAVSSAVTAVGDLQAQIGALSETLGTLETRVAQLETRPVGSEAAGNLPANVEAELKELRAALDVQKGTLSEMIQEASETKQSAEQTARQTMSRAAVTRILVALDSGSPFEAALADLADSSDVAIPEALAQTAADGVPTLSLLAEQFPEVARNALAAARTENADNSIGGFLAKQLGARSVAPRDGDDPDAILSRAEASVKDGRIADALADLEALPDSAKAPLAAWMSQADLRLTAAREAEVLANTLNSQ